MRDEFLESVVDDALEALDGSCDVHTVAFYHDHESRGVSICVDTLDNSRRQVVSQNASRGSRFHAAIERGSVEDARFSEANVGRNLSLGDFSYVNLGGAAEMSRRIRITKGFYLSMIRILIEREEGFLRRSTDPANVLFCASGPDNEVDVVWTARRFRGPESKFDPDEDPDPFGP